VQILYATNGVMVLAGPSTTNSRQYDLHISTNLPASQWLLLQSNVTGSADGSASCCPPPAARPAARCAWGVHVP
jgi:hypothetical protein